MNKRVNEGRRGNEKTNKKGDKITKSSVAVTKHAICEDKV